MPAATIRPAVPADTDAVFGLIRGLAAYERLAHAVSGSAAALREHLFGARSYAEVLIAEADGRAVGFALFFHGYSTFLTRPGLYLEDLFVEPAYRRRGIGTALLGRVAALASNASAAGSSGASSTGTLRPSRSIAGTARTSSRTGASAA
jgi:GNAT superfamily N-acetyltransferase